MEVGTKYWYFHCECSAWVLVT